LFAFCGTEKNTKYHSKKLVIWDLRQNIEVTNSSFNSNICGIKLLKKLILVITSKEINICKIINKDKLYIENITKIPYENHLIKSKIFISENTNTNNPSLSNPPLNKNNINISNNTNFYNNCYEIWNGENNNYYLAVIKNTSNVEIFKIYETSFEIEKYLNIYTQLEFMQSIFYNQILKENTKELIINEIHTANNNKNYDSSNNLNSFFYKKYEEDNQFLSKNSGILFALDLYGINIKVFKINTKEKSYELISNLYRGNSNSFISSVVLLNNRTVAVSSSNKTIHIFELKSENSNDKNNFSNNINSNIISKSYFGNLFQFIKNPFQLNKSIIKIRLNNVVEKHEDSGLYEKDFNEKGNILFYDKENLILKALCYNGKIYYIKLNFEKKEYNIIKIFDWTSFYEKSKKVILEKSHNYSDQFEILKDSSYSESDDNNTSNIQMEVQNIIKESQEKNLITVIERNKDTIETSVLNENKLKNEIEKKQNEEELRNSDSVFFSIDKKNLYIEDVCFNKENVIIYKPDTDRWKII